MRRAILTVSIQGSGKSTYSKYLEKTDPKIKRATKDDLRFMLFDINDYSEKYEKNTKEFGPLLDEMYKQVISTILRQGLTVVVDETNHTKQERFNMKNFLLGLYPDIQIEIHYLMSSFDRCWDRNIKRRPEQIVPRPVMERYYQELVASFDGSADVWTVAEALGREGFTSIKCIDMEKMFI